MSAYCSWNVNSTCVINDCALDPKLKLTTKLPWAVHEKLAKYD